LKLKILVSQFIWRTLYTLTVCIYIG